MRRWRWGPVLAALYALSPALLDDGGGRGGGAASRCAQLGEAGDDESSDDVVPLLQTRRARGPARQLPTAAELVVGEGLPGDGVVLPLPAVNSTGLRLRAGELQGVPQDYWHVALVFLSLGVLCVGTQLLVAECVLMDLRALLGRTACTTFCCLTSCCTNRWWGVGCCASCRGGSTRPKEPPVQVLLPFLLHEVAPCLSPRGLCRLSGASAAFSGAAELCPYQQLLAEARRRGFEGDWLQELAGGAAPAEGEVEAAPEAAKPADAPPPAAAALDAQGGGAATSRALRRWLGVQHERRQHEMELLSAARCSAACADLGRFVILSICWFAFFLEVVRLAQEDGPHDAWESGKAVSAPMLFLYALGQAEEHPGRSALAGVLAAALMLDCLTGPRRHPLV